MKTETPPLSRRPTSDSVEQALQDLFGATARPRLRTGFDRRLARAIEVDDGGRRRGRGVRRIMGAYWSVAALVSTGIVWRLGDELTGPGLWVGIGGVVTLTFAVLAFSLLAPLPATLWRAHRRRST
ncbi:MAG: hypothetical protein O7A98_08545, partial [Acidobacteria bacterium]|nr:hypothetical protein [Acidobacteriota bacterium]MCZ6727391.1 hypothetical protein [Acidobacteriota bacterium]